jgi:hypothetical protein
LSIALDKTVRQRAFRITLIVGCVLALINHGDRLLTLDIDMTSILKIGVTFLVPYGVSTYSSVQAVRDRLQTLR